MVAGVLGMFVFGYASWRGRQNVTLVTEDYEKKIAEIKKANNERLNQRIDNIFGYLWNGQEMDY